MKTKKRRSMRDKVRKKVNSNRGGGFDPFVLPDGFEKFKAKKEGNVRLDFLPYEVKDPRGNPQLDKSDIGELYYERTYFVHKVQNSKGNTQTVCCLKKNFGKPCPICEYVDTLKQDPTENKEEIQSLKFKERQLFNCVDARDNDKKYIFECGYWKTFGEMLDDKIKASDEDDEFDLFADLEGGKTLRIYYKEASFAGHKYFAPSDIAFKDRDEYDDAIVDEMADLDSLLIEKSYDELKNMLLGLDSDNEEEEEEEEDEPKPKKKTKPRKKKVVEEEPVDEDDDVPDDLKPVEEEMEEAEVEEKPKPKKKAKKPVKKEEPVEEDNDDDDDDDDEKEEEKSCDKKCGKCPFGHKFGVDIDESDDCDDCDMWDACDDYAESL